MTRFALVVVLAVAGAVPAPAQTAHHSRLEGDWLARAGDELRHIMVRSDSSAQFGDQVARWRVVGAASGAKGTDIQAEHAIPLVGLKEDVTVQVRRQSGRTEVRVLSRSPSVPWDFGQNARNVRELLAAVDDEMARTR